MTEHECRTLMNSTWFIFQRRCVKECPDKFQSTSPEKGYCEPCQGRCRKVCEGRLVDSIGSAEALHGCTHINGSLTIRDSRDNNIAEELEKSLESIEEIEGYLKIARSFSLQSLNFLKGLRVIRGAVLENKNYSLVVLENENLYKLWDFDDKFNLTILNGSLSFHFNPQLCPKEIEKLAEKIGFRKDVDYTSNDVSELSNGDRSNCTNAFFNMSTVNVTSSNVTVYWEDLRDTLNDSLVGYFLYWIKEEEQTFNVVSGNAKDTRDEVCEGTSWNSIFTTKSEALITNLTPDTRYAYYVKTYLTNSVGNRSQQLFFKTLSDDPSVLIDVKAVSTSSNSVLLKWSPPLHPNGNLSHYILTYIKEDENKDLLVQRNYCNNPFVPTVTRKLIREENMTMDDCCGVDLLSLLMSERDVFNNICSNLTGPYSGDCRNYASQIHYGSSTVEKTVTIEDGAATEYNVTGLDHYGLYVFYISACNSAENEPIHCGPAAMVSERTLKKVSALSSPLVSCSYGPSAGRRRRRTGRHDTHRPSRRCPLRSLRRTRETQRVGARLQHRVQPQQLRQRRLPELRHLPATSRFWLPPQKQGLPSRKVRVHGFHDFVGR